MPSCQRAALTSPLCPSADCGTCRQAGRSYLMMREIRQALAFVGYKKIKLDEEEQTVFLENKGMAIDLGGIAKGYAGDEVVRILKEHDVEHALINLGATSW